MKGFAVGDPRAKAAGQKGGQRAQERQRATIAAWQWDARAPVTTGRSQARTLTAPDVCALILALRNRGRCSIAKPPDAVMSLPIWKPSAEFAGLLAALLPRNWTVAVVAIVTSMLPCWSIVASIHTPSLVAETASICLKS